VVEGTAVGRVVVVGVVWESEDNIAAMVVAGGFGTVEVAGTNAMVTSCPFSHSRSSGGPLVSVPFPFDSKLFQLSTMTTPGFPWSGVPFGQIAPLFHACLPGYCNVDEDNSSPLYPETNLPRVAFAPDSELFSGAMVTTPWAPAVNPVCFVLVLGGRGGCIVPQMSIPRAACQTWLVVGGPDEEEV
jgi:hypothetical protein